MNWRQVSLGLALVAGGVVIGQLLPDGANATSALPPVQGAESPSGQNAEEAAAERSAAREEAQLLRAEVRKLAGAVQQLQGSHKGQPEGTAAPTVPESEPPTAAQRQAFLTAVAAVDNAMAAGTWTDEDKQALERLTSSLAATDVHEVHSMLAEAINDGRIEVTTQGPPIGGI